MSNSAEHSGADGLDRSTQHEVHELCTRLLDEVISDEQLARLDRLLSTSSSAREIYLRYVGLSIALGASSEKQQQTQAEQFRRHIASSEEANGARLEPRSTSDWFSSGEQAVRRKNRFKPRTGWAISAALLIAGIAAGLAYLDSSSSPGSTEASAEQQNDATPAADSPTTAPRLSYVSPNALWQDPNDSFHKESSVAFGNVLALVEGEIELTYSTGVKLLLIGPAEFLVKSTGGKLVRGGAVASVPEAGHGFTIETPSGKVVDLGTEFGVAVDDFGVSEVSVFQGRVEAFPDNEQGHGKKVELSRGHGLQWDQNTVKPLDADLRRFAASLLDRTIAVRPATAEPELVDLFREGMVDPEKWKSLGRVESAGRGVLLGGGAEREDPAYLISRRQFDPANGPIVVTCDFRFEEGNSSGGQSFSLLTRSADQRGVALPPYRGTAATCARCSFGSELATGEGHLQTGVKLAKDRELTNISYGGFAGPVRGVPYRVVVRDDGVNISFTVALRDDPSMAKTVTFRSLFRGRTNFVALEGPVQGAVLIERVEVSQDRATKSFSNYSDFADLVVDSRQRRSLRAELLEQLAPPDAQLILEEDFQLGVLDSDQWQTWGAVSIRDGSVQLGLPNLEEHIDTWNERPYLLFRRPVEPRSGPVTITGEITFAENFLSGYGASFAVMTRAVSQRGHDPGWASSLLQRGIRANFWPAAWDSKRSLEVHEITGPNAIELLEAREGRVDPEVRTYVFRGVDNGRSVEFTIFDPTRPERPMSVRAATGLINEQGLVGFESTWGSPVILDNIRIYQATNSSEARVE